MRFVERIRLKKNRSRKNTLSKYAWAKKLGMSPQAYHVLVTTKRRDRMRIHDLLAMRRELGLSDKQLLDYIEKEYEQYAE